MQDAVEYLFNSKALTVRPHPDTSRLAGGLPVTETQRNDLWQDGAEELTAEIAQELKHYSREELLATSIPSWPGNDPHASASPRPSCSGIARGWFCRAEIKSPCRISRRSLALISFGVLTEALRNRFPRDPHLAPLGMPSPRETARFTELRRGGMARSRHSTILLNIHGRRPACALSFVIPDILGWFDEMRCLRGISSRISKRAPELQGDFFRDRSV